MSKNYDFKNHWDTAYIKNSIEDLGWYEYDPKASLELINKCDLSKDSMIFNAGAGATELIKKLIDAGYHDCLLYTSPSPRD